MADPMLIAGSFSVIAGFAYVIASTMDDPKLNGSRLERRRRRQTSVPA